MRSAVAARPCAPAARIARADCMRGLLGHKFVAARTGAVSSGGCSAKRSSGRPVDTPGSIPSALACRGSRLDAIDSTTSLRCVSPTSALGEFGGPRDWYAKQFACSIRQL